ncbi:hypothetical protein FYJ27_07995 [Anaerosalibacter bizertensis]|uniref:Uncharacterized protein n=1 Tax=Anaerosalibacter bizertensis TaxID=932217 RepID=A0A844FIE0_9FIRM|nr:hypothetical protein [Anaerosalibacter bizertensis]MSS43665.1 hypothetical protein [Anaerosalibacter bizertensis]
MDKISISLTKKELDILNRALTGYERELNDFLDVEEELNAGLISEETLKPYKKKLNEVSKLDKKIMDIKWDKFCWKRKVE